MGSEEEHREWDSREELRPMLEKEVEVVLGEEDRLEPLNALDSETFLFTLLSDDAVFNALRVGEMEKVRKLIKQKRETFLTTTKKDELLIILRDGAKAALGDNHGISNVTLNLLLDDKNIFEAAKAVKISEEKNDEAAEMAAGHNLLMLLGKAR